MAFCLTCGSCLATRNCTQALPGGGEAVQLAYLENATDEYNLGPPRPNLVNSRVGNLNLEIQRPKLPAMPSPQRSNN